MLLICINAPKISIEQQDTGTQLRDTHDEGLSHNQGFHGAVHMPYKGSGNRSRNQRPDLPELISTDQKLSARKFPIRNRDRRVQKIL